MNHVKETLFACLFANLNFKINCQNFHKLTQRLGSKKTKKQCSRIKNKRVYNKKTFRTTVSIAL